MAMSITYSNQKINIGCFYRPRSSTNDIQMLFNRLSWINPKLSHNLIATHFSPSSISSTIDLVFIPTFLHHSHLILPPVSSSDYNSILVTITLLTITWPFPHMKSNNCSFSCKFIHLCILFHLQMMCILYFTYSTVCRSSICHCVNHSVFKCLS